MDLKTIGLNRQFRKDDSLAGRPSNYELSIRNDITEEKNPLKQNTIVTKKLYQSTLGGSVQFLDATGGTTILSYNPETGTITLNGGVQAQVTVNFGTINNALYNSGTINTSRIDNGTLGTPVITGGTLNNAIVGTPNITGGSYTNLRVLGTPIFDINSGTAGLSFNGELAIQIKSGSAVLVVKAGGTNFFFNSSGTM